MTQTLETFAGAEGSAGETPATKAAAAPRRRVQDIPGFYVFLLVAVAAAGLLGIWKLNKAFAPEMYAESGPKAFAEAFAKGRNFGTFDLNINIREMRDHHIRMFKETPEVVVLGASHWQEGHVELMPGRKFYNAHVHRDYYEDMLAMVEMFTRHSRLPKKMIIAIRDRLFTPVADRKDFLWLPGIPYYRDMARRLNMEPHPYWSTAPVERWRELISLPMLVNNVRRWYSEPTKPHETRLDHFETLDTLRPGGSIYWSGEHMKVFTQERSRKLSEEFAEQNFNNPPPIDPKGVEKLERLFAYLKERKVEVFFVHPPFNPIYWDKVQNSPYMKGVEKIRALTRSFAEKFDFKVFGHFDPAHYGCTAEMYIDAEHSNPECLRKVFAEYIALDPVDGSTLRKDNETPVAGLAPQPKSNGVAALTSPIPAPFEARPAPEGNSNGAATEAEARSTPRSYASITRDDAEPANGAGPTAEPKRESLTRQKPIIELPSRANRPAERTRNRRRARGEQTIPLPERNPLDVLANGTGGLISIGHEPALSPFPQSRALGATSARSL
ncbi:MAG: hypothetical protein AAFU50_01945 [Pseudomonadota bacterium]